jgi:hypothetical protein
VVTTGSISPISVTELEFNLGGTTTLADLVGNVKVYYTGNSNAFATGNLFDSNTLPGGTFGWSLFSGSQTLAEGSNYFWLTVDIDPTATLLNVVDGRCRRVTVDGVDVLSATAQNPAGNRPIVAVVPSPGGAGSSNLTAWFKADGLAVGNLTSWSTTYPTGVSSVTLSDGSAPYSQVEITPTNNIFNYNKVVSFAGNTALNQTFLSNTNALNLLTNQNAGSEGTFFVIYARSIVAVSNDGVVTFKNGQHGIQCRSWGRLALGQNNSANGTRNFTPNPPLQQHIIGYSGNKSSGASMFGVRNDLEISNSSASSADMKLGLTFGAKRNTNTTYNEYFDGYIADVIFFDDNLSASEINKVNSYLGINYGVKLDNTGGGAQGDYYSGQNELIWDASNEPQYHNDVIGIGRDDIQSLDQKQSHTYRDTFRVYIDNLTSSNSLNSGNFLNDHSYIVVGSDLGSICANSNSIAEMPATCALYSRLEREWKLTKTNFSQNFNVDIKLNSCANTGSVNPNELRFMVDDDGDFSNGGTSCYFNGDGTGIVIAYVGPIITISNLSNTHFSNNQTMYFTIGSVLSSTPLPVELYSFTASCENNHINYLEWETKSELNNDYFQIEKSYDGVIWEIVARLDGSGTSSTSNYYNYSDFERYNKLTYYRLKQFDLNGEENIYNTIKVSCDNVKTPLVYPNPFDGQIVIEYDSDLPYSVELRDLLGRVVYKSNLVNETEDIFIFNPAEFISKGVYFISVIENSEVILNKKIVKK